jgi:hypothetical protein
MNVIGIIKQIGQTQSVPTKSGQPFIKRKLVLDAAQYDRYTGQKLFDNFPSFEFTGERVKLLDGLQPGQLVNVSFDIYGKYSESNNDYFNSVVGYKIEPVVRHQPAQPQQSQPQQPAATPQPQVYYQHPQQPQQPSQPAWTPPQVGDDGLPF